MSSLNDRQSNTIRYKEIAYHFTFFNLRFKPNSSWMTSWNLILNWYMKFILWIEKVKNWIPVYEINIQFRTESNFRFRVTKLNFQLYFAIFEEIRATINDSKPDLLNGNHFIHLAKYGQTYWLHVCVRLFLNKLIH